MRNIFYSLLIFLGFLIFFIKLTYVPIAHVLGVFNIAGIKVTSLPNSAVYLNGKSLGRTPIESDSLQPGEYDLRLDSSQGGWEGKVRLNQGTVTLVNRDLSENIASSSGEVLTLMPGTGVVITSNPDKADLKIDGKDYGTTPRFISNILAGEHDFVLSKESFLKRDVRAKIPPGKILDLNVDLAITETNFGEDVHSSIIKSVSQQAIVNNTPLGYVRLRSTPSIYAKEITTVSSGKTVTVLSQNGSWTKVGLNDGTVGFIDSSYLSQK